MGLSSRGSPIPYIAPQCFYAFVKHAAHKSRIERTKTYRLPDDPLVHLSPRLTRSV